MSVSHRPLRIGIVTDGLDERTQGDEVQIANGGVGVYIYNLVQHLAEIDSINEYFLIRHGGGQLDLYQTRGDHAVILRRTTLSRLARAFDLPYRRLATALRLDLIHFPNQFGGAFLPARFKRVVTLHDVTPLLFPAYHPWSRVAGYRLLLRPSMHAADHVIVDSAHTRTDLLTRGLISENKVSVVPLAAGAAFRPGIHTADFTGRYDLPWPFILTVGVLEPRKNHVVLVEALRHLHAQGDRVGLVIVGREGWRWQDPLAEPALAPLRPWVRIVRNVSDADLAELYNRAAVFAYPSLYEGFGLPVIEAMACGTPVVTSTRSSLPEVAGDAALYADPTDAADFAAKLGSVLRDPNLHRQLSTDGRRRAAELSWQRTAALTLGVYERVCGRSADQHEGDVTREAGTERAPFETAPEQTGPPQGER